MNSFLKTQLDYINYSDLKNTIEAEDLYHLIIELKKPNPKIEKFAKTAREKKNSLIKNISFKSHENMNKEIFKIEHLDPVFRNINVINLI